MPLHQHKRLVLNLIAAELLRPRSVGEQAEAERRIAEKIRAEFLDDHGHEAEFDNPKVSVQEVVADRIKKITRVKSLLDSEEKKHFNRFHKQLRPLADENHLCKKCACDSKQPCRDDTAHDAKLLNEPGLCIKVINDCYTYLRQHVQGLLEAWAFEDIATNDPVTITLDRCFIGGDPRATWSPGYYRGSVGGATAYRDGPLSRGSELILELNGAHFSWESLLSVPWVITHELVCHAFQGRTGPCRQGCSKKCPFYEGWMDEVASMLLDEIVTRGPLVECTVETPKLLADHGALVRQETADFRRWRYKVGLQGRGSPETHWEQGQYAARAVLQFFKTRIATSQSYLEALKLLVRLSMFIQRRDPTESEASRIALLLGNLGMSGNSKKCNKAASDGICKLMFSQMKTGPWINELDAELDRFTC